MRARSDLLSRSKRHEVFKFWLSWLWLLISFCWLYELLRQMFDLNLVISKWITIFETTFHVCLWMLVWSELTDFGLRLPFLSLVVFQTLAWGCFSRPRGRGAIHPTSTAQALLMMSCSDSSDTAKGVDFGLRLSFCCVVPVFPVSM